jgi:MFS family permease
MAAFSVIWFGQLVSMVGTSMTRFALTVWAYQTTGSAAVLAQVGFFSFVPIILVTPFAGALVDRWNRKLVMVLSDLGAGLSTIALLILFLTGNLQIWHIMVAGAFAGIFESFQFPAFSASISTMLSKTQYVRANAMMSLAESGSSIVAPVLAGVLLPIIGIGGIMTIDIVTFSLAVLAVLVVFIPQPRRSQEGEEAGRGIWREAVYGFRYIWRRPSLLGLQASFFFSNLFSAIGIILLPAMILARTGNDATTLGFVQSALGIGGVVGGLLLTTWGGPQRRIHGLLIGFIGISLLGQTLLGIGQALPMWLAAGFFMGFFIPFINGSNQAIWQAKVAPDVQGRVFAARRIFAQVTIPLGFLLGGYMADGIFEPLMMDPSGFAARFFEPLVGSGPGAGMGLLFVITGLLGAAVGMAGYVIPVIRNAEEILPDHVELVAPADAAVEAPVEVPAAAA